MPSAPRLVIPTWPTVAPGSNREKLRTAAIDLLAGPHQRGGVKFAAIVEHSGVPKGSGYREYNGIEELLGDLHLESIRVSYDGFIEGLEVGADSPRLLGSAVRSMIRSLEQAPWTGQVLPNYPGMLQDYFVRRGPTSFQAELTRVTTWFAHYAVGASGDETTAAIEAFAWKVGSDAGRLTPARTGETFTWDDLADVAIEPAAALTDSLATATHEPVGVLLAQEGDFIGYPDTLSLVVPNIAK